jgi:hypothetical protein
MTAQNQPPPRAIANLMVFDTLIDAFVVTYSNPAMLLRAAAGGLMLLAVASLLYLALPNLLTATVMAFVPFAAYSHFGVNWYRFLLLGPEGMVQPVLRWDGRHWRFFTYGVLLTLSLIALGMLVATLLPMLPPALISVGLWYLAARCSFLFPAIAVAEPYSLVLSWQHTKGQGLRLTAALLIAVLPLSFAVAMIASWLFFSALGISLADIAALQAEMAAAPAGSAPMLTDVIDLESISPVAVVSANLAVIALCMAVLAVLYSIVALAFRTCTGWVPASAAKLPTARYDTADDDPDGPDEPPSDRNGDA